MQKVFPQYYSILYKGQGISLGISEGIFTQTESTKDYRESKTHFEWTYNNKGTVWSY